MIYQMHRPGTVDTWRLVARGILPSCAVDVERTRALIEAMTFDDALLQFVAFGNEDSTYGAVCQAEIRRRDRLEREP